MRVAPLKKGFFQVRGMAKNLLLRNCAASVVSMRFKDGDSVLGLGGGSNLLSWS